MALVSTRPVKHLSVRYLNYIKDTDSTTSGGEIGGYTTTPFQFGFLIRPASINSTYGSYDSSTPTVTSVLKIKENKFSGAIFHMASFCPTLRFLSSSPFTTSARGCRVRNGVFRFYDQETLNPNYQGFDLASLNREYDVEYPQVYVQPPFSWNAVDFGSPYSGPDQIQNTLEMSAVLEDGGQTIVFQVTHYRPDRVKGHFTLF